MSSVDPAEDATNVALSSNVRATLNLPGEGGLNVTTLSDAAVTLTDASGVSVPAKRTLEGSTIVLDPDADLIIDTSYTFSVTSAVETADNIALQPFSSSFSTGDSVEPPPGTGLSATPAKVVFTAGTPTGSDTRTLTLTNNDTETLDVSGLSVTGADAARFALSDSSTFSLAPGTSRDLSVTFNSKGVGPQLAALSVQSSASSLEVPLGGLGVEGQGGNKEPSLQWILDTYGIDVESGDADPSTFNLVDSPTNGFVGDEVAGQTFTKALPTAPVTAEVLAAFGVENDPVLSFGYYTAGQPDAQTALFDIQQTPTLNAQRLAPEVTATGGTVSGNTVTFDPGTGSFGLYSFWPTNKFFSERTVYTEDRLNTFTKAIPHQVRAYPLPGEANAYVIATEEFSSGFDYNDVVIILHNVVPDEAADTGGKVPIPLVPSTPAANGISGLKVSNAIGLPYSDRLILQKIEDTTGKFCDAANPRCDPTVDQWTDIGFPTTGRVDLQNTGGAALQLSLSVLNDNLFVFPNGESTITVAPGETYPLDVAFNPVGFDTKGVYPAGLVVQSGGQSAGIQLAGLYMLKPEGSREVFFAPLLNDLFGYQVDLGEFRNGGLENPTPDSPLAGEEVRSAFWEAANPSSPVSVLQIAAFYPCCNIGQFNMKLIGRGDSKTNPFATLSHSGNDTQSIYPRQNNGDLAQLTATPDGAFEINVANSYSTNSRGGNLGVRLWPLRDRSGRLVADSYIVAQDFVKPGCNGFGVPEVPTDGSESEPPGNCDYNDNMYIMENIKPVN